MGTLFHKRNIIFIFLCFSLFVIIQCSKDDSTSDDSITTPVIEEINVEITTPKKERDFSYHSMEAGIYHNPENKIELNAKLNIKYKDFENTLPLSSINVIWRSNLDGVLFKGSPNEFLQSKISTELTKGTHKIFFETEIPSKEVFIKDSILISNNISLSAESTGKSVKLNWSKYEGSAFISYLIYNENSVPIAEISNINTLNYEHSDTTSSILKEKEFQIIVNTSNNRIQTIGSNIVEKSHSIYIKFKDYITKTIKDTLRDRVYAIVRPISNLSKDYGLLIIDVKENNFQINSHILKDFRIDDIDISPDGQNMFLCGKGEYKIIKLNLETLNIKIFDDMPKSFQSIEIGNNNSIYVHSTSPTTGSSSFYIINGNSGNVYGPIYGKDDGDMELNDNTQDIYISSGSKHGKQILQKLKFNGTNFSKISSFPNTYEWPYHPDNFLLLSEDKEHIYWENIELDKNLNLKRVFDSKMINCSPSNKYLSDSKFIYDYSTLKKIYKHPFNNIENTTINFMNDDKVLIFKSSYYAIDIEEYMHTYIFKVNLK